MNRAQLRRTLKSGGLTEFDVGGSADAFVLDADGDTTISAPTDDQIDFECGGVDICTMTATSVLSNAQLGTSDGGTVTQATDHTTGVTLNANAGQITLASVDLAAGAEATFTVTNSAVSATDVVIVNVADEQDASGTLFAFVSDVGAGAFDITLTNLHASTAGGNDASVLNFVVIQGASS